ncbi:hypothetical protein [Streptomyces sp. MST-110588]|uniref:hypothetical protein n=1 Tax=Streptomyces sp. MST-110588 TaxID=2833628 RepID=UPI001F5D337D|nr:hypothetical protein [Streptomyces sp. MST-110588]UNO42069.1 hypothetical protein KGS77_24300 [Streptomyces sp. MST-110588]
MAVPATAAQAAGSGPAAVTVSAPAVERTAAATADPLAGNASADQAIKAAEAGRPVAVRAAAAARFTGTSSISRFDTSLNKFAVLTAKGDLKFRGTKDRAPKVIIAWSANGRNNWYRAKTVAVRGGHFSTSFNAPAKGFYAAVYQGTSKIRGSVSKILKEQRTETRISGFDAGPEPVRRGHKLTVTGTLQHKTAGWKAYGKQKVQILFRPKGDRKWYLRGEVRTGANGTFRKSFTADVDGTWLPVFFYPDGKHFVGVGKEDFVDVR